MNKLFAEDFTTKKAHIDCSIGYILRKKCVNLDGTLKNNECSEKLTKESVLHYLAYLWHNNPSIDLFSEMKSTPSFKNITVAMLVKYINEHQPVHKKRLLNANGSLKYVTNKIFISFVNHLIRTHKDMHIPIATNIEDFEKYLDKKLEQQSARYDNLVESITTNVKNPVIRSMSTHTNTSGMNGSPKLSASIQVTKATLRRHNNSN